MDEEVPRMRGGNDAPYLSASSLPVKIISTLHVFCSYTKIVSRFSPVSG